MKIVVNHMELLTKIVLKCILLLIVLMDFISISCFGMIDKSERKVSVRINKHNNHAYLVQKVENYDNKKDKRQKNFCCCKNLYYYLNWVIESFSQKKQALINLKPKSFLEALPNVIVIETSTYLDPLSIMKLSHVSGRFRKILNNDFWMRYNTIHSYEIFTEAYSTFLIWSSTRETPPIKVMLANYYFEFGRIEKASLLGLPTAQKYLEKKNSQTFSNSSTGYCYYCPRCHHSHSKYEPWCRN